jgi:hypothetical protein
MGINMLSAYDVVIEGACKLGVKKIVLARSVLVYEVTFADGVVDFASLPFPSQKR